MAKEQQRRGRGRPPGARNKKGSKKAPTAAGTVETTHNEKKTKAANGTADNVVHLRPKVTPEQERTEFFKYRTRYEKQLAKKKEVDADLRNLAKAIRADGYSVEAIKLSLLDEVVFEAKVREDVERLRQVADWMKLPIGTQLNLLEPQPDREDAEEKAFNAGEVAGLAGQNGDPPYANNLPQANAWRKGYRQGQAALAKKFVLKDEKEEAPATVKTTGYNTEGDGGPQGFNEDAFGDAPPTAASGGGGFIGE